MQVVPLISPSSGPHGTRIIIIVITTITTTTTTTIIIIITTITTIIIIIIVIIIHYPLSRLCGSSIDAASAEAVLGAQSQTPSSSTDFLPGSIQPAVTVLGAVWICKVPQGRINL